MEIWIRFRKATTAATEGEKKKRSMVDERGGKE
jgi:hypothetical protein